mmetsp:Transcript_3798/g.10745  ORF Transcript_3798/g.10745 Transcript_3798/m.10745 type:complete len:304 (-) Transcript_3798:2829-3740(-)
MGNILHESIVLNLLAFILDRNAVRAHQRRYRCSIQCDRLFVCGPELVLKNQVALHHLSNLLLEGVVLCVGLGHPLLQIIEADPHILQLFILLVHFTGHVRVLHGKVFIDGRIDVIATAGGSDWLHRSDQGLGTGYLLVFVGNLGLDPIDILLHRRLYLLDLSLHGILSLECLVELGFRVGVSSLGIQKLIFERLDLLLRDSPLTFDRHFVHIDSTLQARVIGLGSGLLLGNSGNILEKSVALDLDLLQSILLVRDLILQSLGILAIIGKLPSGNFKLVVKVLDSLLVLLGLFLGSIEIGLGGG